MSYKVNNKAAYTFDGIPYLWNSGDVTTLPSNEVKIVASDPVIDDLFARSISVYSNRIVSGASLDSNANGSEAGAAYIFDFNGNEIIKILAPDGQADDNFGRSVAAGSGRIVVGSIQRGFQVGPGAAYIFDLDGNFISKISPSDGGNGDEFGTSLEIGCGRIVVGSPRHDLPTTTCGAAYIFDLDGNELKKITASDAGGGDNFGTSVSVGSGRIVVGAPFNDDAGSSSGSAYIFDLDGNEIKKITASDAASSNTFGRYVSVKCGRIVVGADGNSTIASDAGAAYIFDLDGNELKKITASDAAAGDDFGFSTAIGSGRILVGAPLADPNGINAAGAAYVFDLDGNELLKITANTANAGDNFGGSFGIGHGKVVIGAYGDVGGAAYIYDTPQVYNLYDAIDLKENS